MAASVGQEVNRCHVEEKLKNMSDIELPHPPEEPRGSAPIKNPMLSPSSGVVRPGQRTISFANQLSLHCDYHFPFPFVFSLLPRIRQNA